MMSWYDQQPPQAVISMAGYGLTEKRLQPARLRNLYGGLQLRETTAAYGGLRRRLRGLHLNISHTPYFGLKLALLRWQLQLGWWQCFV